MMLKLYRWIFRYAENKCQKYHKFADLKCPQCNFWFSAVDGEVKNTDNGYVVICAQCRAETFWITNIFPFPIREDDIK